MKAQSGHVSLTWICAACFCNAVTNGSSVSATCVPNPSWPESFTVELTAVASNCTNTSLTSIPVQVTVTPLPSVEVEGPSEPEDTTVCLVPGNDPTKVLFYTVNSTDASATISVEAVNATCTPSPESVGT